ncbi:MAG: hypothetical protein WC917_04825 [Bacilli bacterium]|jgi:hypothetical protein
MADYGFRISSDGVDVKTGDDLDMVVTSKYPLLKGVLSGSGSESNNGDEKETAIINHGLGYIPFAQVYIKLSDEDYWQELPVCRSGMEAGILIRHYCNTSDLKIVTEQYGEDSRTIYYQYFIYLDKGKL